MDYYPHQLSISAINKEFNGLDLVDEDEEQRLQDVADKRKRGKGAPKKAKSAGMGLLFLYHTGSWLIILAADSRRAQRKRERPPDCIGRHYRTQHSL